MNWHGYILVEHVPPGWTQNERRSAWNALRAIGRQVDPQPANCNHSRENLAGTALVVEALFEEAEITREAIVTVIADALHIGYPAVDTRIRYTVFAPGGAWQESGAACRAYLTANAAEWEPID